MVPNPSPSRTIAEKSWLRSKEIPKRRWQQGRPAFSPHFSYSMKADS
jgi:hypothetical protein